MTSKYIYQSTYEAEIIDLKKKMNDIVQPQWIPIESQQFKVLCIIFDDEANDSTRKKLCLTCWSIETRTTAINHFQNFHSIAFPGEFSGTKKNVKSGNHDKKLSTQEKIIKLATEYQHILPEKGQIKLPVFRKKLDKKTAIFNNITKDRKIDIQKTGIFTNMTMDRTIFCRQPNFVKNSEESDTSSLNEETTRMMRNSSGLAPMMTDFKAMEKKIDEFMSEFKQRQISMNKKLDELICLVNIKPQPDIKTKRKASSNSISSKSSNSSKGDENKMTQKLRKIIKN